MRGFHIDMHMAQLRGDYIRKWLRRLARMGFDTLIWEIENNIQWKTCPECVSKDAFTKTEFKDVLKEAKDLGFESIPLLQTIGHAEYVLKHERYAELRELPDRVDQYCPRNPRVVSFLHRWIEEYLQVFGEIRRFHMGADEARALGMCRKCSAYSRQYSVSRLYIDHVNAVARPLVKNGITPIIWADMALHHNEALNRLSRDIMLFDWSYDSYEGMGRFFVWGEGWRNMESVKPSTRKKFNRFLFPEGDEPGREPQPFYTADFLAAHDFQVATCPSSASWGDNVFSPRLYYHMRNTFDSFKKGSSARLDGSVLTSWSIRVHPWEMQTACMEIPNFIRLNPHATIEDFMCWYEADRFATDSGLFWQAAGLLARPCVFTQSTTLGYKRTYDQVPDGFVWDYIKVLRENRGIPAKKNECRARLREYRKGAGIFKRLLDSSSRGKSELRVWELGARNLVNRAEASLFLLEHSGEYAAGRRIRAEHARKGRGILRRLEELRVETEELYRSICKPQRRRQTMEYVFGSIAVALHDLV